MRNRPPKGVQVVHKRLSDGTPQTYYYHRLSRTKLKAEHGTAAFYLEITKAEEAFRNGVGYGRIKGTLKEHIAKYLRSTKFTDKAERTRLDYLKQITIIEAKWGDAPVEIFNDRAIRGDIMDWRDDLAKRSRKQADYAVTVLGIIIASIHGRGDLAHNHVAKIDRLYEADRSENIWLPEHVAAFNAKARAVLRNALMLALHTGQRQGDLLRLSWSAYDGSALHVRQGKTGNLVIIPCTAALRQMLDGLARDNAVILTNAKGAAWKGNAFRLAWRRAFKEAKLSGLTFHDLRGTAVTMLAEAGCTVPEIASITGHTMQTATAILEKYLSRTRGLALAGIRKLENKTRAGAVN